MISLSGYSRSGGGGQHSESRWIACGKTSAGRWTLRRGTTLTALFVAALCLFATPVAGDQLRESEPISFEKRTGSLHALAARAMNPVQLKSLSGTTLLGQAPRARMLDCVLPFSDNLDAGAPGTTGSYSIEDESQNQNLWGVLDRFPPPCDIPGYCPVIPDGSTRALWCGQRDGGWPVDFGYPNNAYQILYVDTGSHAIDYTLTLDFNISCELNYDELVLIGGGGGAVDPICNSRTIIDEVLRDGSSGASQLLAGWTGSILTSTPNALSMNTTSGAVLVVGSGDQAPQGIVGATITIASAHRALYFVFKSDGRSSTEDGLWCFGKGLILDRLSTSDHGAIYTNETPSGGMDACGGVVLVGPTTAPIVSGRVPSGFGGLWEIRAGNAIPTGDICSPSKDTAADHLFFPGSGTDMTTPNSFSSIIGCTFEVPVNVASVRITWNEYLDLPRGSGYVQSVEYRTSATGTGGWSPWDNLRASGTVRSGGIKAWITDGEELTQCSRGFFVQLRYTLQCVDTPLPYVGAGCGAIPIGLLYDDFKIEALPGLSLPEFGIHPGSIAQTTFVDGTMRGSNCATVPCWPGIRGSDLGVPAGGIDDNFNSPLGDSITISIRPSLGTASSPRVNWHHAFDKSVNGGRTIAHTNVGFIPAYDVPRCIYRLFDPATKTWSPFDSTELDADAVTIAQTETPGFQDTTVAECAFRMDWPPRDKLAAAATLPGGFTINGVAAYAALRFLPHGTRVQYYFKAVDVAGRVAYQFQTDAAGREVEDLPFLPGGGIRASDIIEFDVLPRVYAPGAGGTCLAGQTATPLLNLDGGYTQWSFEQDPVTQALRGLGVRADRYRLLQGLREGNNVGGAELLGQAPERPGNFFPNYLQYSIVDSLAAWYRLVIVSSHVRTSTTLNEQDASLLFRWWVAQTPGADGGDRCIFISGDDAFNSLLNPPVGFPGPEQAGLAQQVFGVQSAIGTWSGASTNQYPTIDDRFAAPPSGPGLAPPGTFPYPLDGGCPIANRFDGLVPIASAGVQGVASYPTGSEFAGVAQMAELDALADRDRNKALGYGFSLQFIRQAGIPPTDSNYPHSGVENRMRVLYKFITSCRGPRTGPSSSVCWPCPTDANMTGNWNVLSGFQTATYGPLYCVQDYTDATGVTDPVGQAPPFVNELAQNRPNPFNPTTVIPYSLASSGRVTIRIIDVAGRLVRTLVEGRQTAGPHVVRWNGRGDQGQAVASGVYFCTIVYPDGKTSARKLTILR